MKNKQRLLIELHPDIVKLLKITAVQLDMTVAQLVTMLIEKFTKKEGELNEKH